VKPSAAPGKRAGIGAARRRDLIRGTIASIARLGYHNSTVQTICEEAGLSRGLIGHYFEGKDDLLLEAFRYLVRQLRQETRRAMNTVGPDPLDRLLAVIDVTFRKPVMGRDEAAVWLAFWGVVYWHPGLRKVHLQVWRAYRRSISRLLEGAARDRDIALDARMAGWTFAQLVDGLWLGWVMDETAYTPEEAKNIMREWVLNLLDRSLPRQSSARRPRSFRRAPSTAEPAD
jgi:TetR/AcrR family transcriptional repressor of bet genes